MPPPAKECFSPDIYADLLSIQKDCRKEIQELIISSLKVTPDDPTALCLQPVVWAYLLQKLLSSGPNNLEVLQLLFIEIPPFYWSADFIPPTSAIERKGMKTSHEDGIATTLRMAIQGGLYLYVTEVILQAHVSIEQTAFLWKLIGIYPPQDPQLYLLLNMAIPVSRSLDSLFSRILRGVGEFLGVNSYDNNLPAVAFDTNRHTVLRLLYMLISSVAFHKILTHHDQIFVLLTFFRVMNSTSPLPSFFAENWCTPQLATKSVQIAFKDVSSASAYELGDHFLQYTPFTNEGLADFVSSLFEQLRAQDNRKTLNSRNGH